MEFFEVIDKRYSHKTEFTGENLSLEKIKKIVDAGRKAPSGKNLQPREFIIITKQEIIDKVADEIQKGYIREASALIVVVGDPKPRVPIGDKELQFYIHDCCASVENMLLATTALGYASCWIDGALRKGKCEENLKQLLGIPKEKELMVVLPVGVAKEVGWQKPKKAFDEIVYYEKYGSKK
jgi:nitroreductase